MTDAPETIWAMSDRRKTWQIGPPEDGQEPWHWEQYTRTDLIPTWQPIETAPKPELSDRSVSRYILGFTPCGDGDPQSMIDVVWWEPQINGGTWWSNLDLPAEPTHWMPLPAAPSQEGRS